MTGLLQNSYAAKRVGLQRDRDSGLPPGTPVAFGAACGWGGSTLAQLLLANLSPEAWIVPPAHTASK